jgi:hypothetical protein
MFISISTTMGEGLKTEANPTERARALDTIKAPEPASLKHAPRCQARNRAGKSCGSPAVKGKRVCRLHGGAKGSGAPKGEANGAYRHGGWTQEAVAVRREAAAILKAVKEAAA